MSADPPPPPPSSTPPSAPTPLPGPADETALPFGSGKLSAADDRLFCILAQFFSFIIWPWKKDESPAVDLSGKEALNFFLTAFGVQIVLAILAQIPVVGCLSSILSTAVGIATLVLVVIAALKASDGKFYRYPISLRLIK
jgi:uncharacterized Tic20 family protein